MCLASFELSNRPLTLCFLCPPCHFDVVQHSTYTNFWDVSRVLIVESSAHALLSFPFDVVQQSTLPSSLLASVFFTSTPFKLVTTSSCPSSETRMFLPTNKHKVVDARLTTLIVVVRRTVPVTLRLIRLNKTHTTSCHVRTDLLLMLRQPVC